MDSKIKVSLNDRFRIVKKSFGEKEQPSYFGIMYLNETVDKVSKLIRQKSVQSELSNYFLKNVYKHWELPIRTFHETIGLTFIESQIVDVVIHKDDPPSNIYIPTFQPTMKTTK